MTNLDSLRALQARIRSATGADREIDFAIVKTLGGMEQTEISVLNINGSTERTTVWHPKNVDAREFWHAMEYRLEEGDGENAVPRFTTDPDGLGPCVGLMREVLPGWWWCVGDSADGDNAASVRRGGDGPEIEAEKLANTCLTFLDAIFSAKISELEARETVG